MATIVYSLFFYGFAFFMLSSALAAILAKSPITSVLSLILCFFNAAGLFMLVGAEFLALILIVVYVGAVAVLFLFVVMMLNINFAEVSRKFVKFLPYAVLIGVIIAGELIASISYFSNLEGFYSLNEATFKLADEDVTASIGYVIYTDYFILFQLAGLILLVAMISAIVLTLRPRKNNKSQIIANQVARTKEQGLRKVDVNPGEGLR